MDIQYPHRFDVSPAEALQIQKELKEKLIFEPCPKNISLVAGTDISCSRGSTMAYGVVVVLSMPELEVVEVVSRKKEILFPYIPGLLAFREVPLLVEIFSQVKHIPDVVICDGQGIAHPRGIGLASHLGLFINLPTLGCGKTYFIGDYNKPADKDKAHTELTWKGQRIGSVLRTRKGSQPVFISPGHKMDVDGSLDVALRCLRGCRLPEPTRMAHLESNRARKREEEPEREDL